MNHSPSIPCASTTISIPAHQLLCIKEFAARKDVRYYLNAIHFRTDGSRAYLSATDGHMGAILRSPEGAVTGPNISWIVPIELFDGLGKRSPITLTFSTPAARYEEGEADTASVSDGSAGNSQSAYEQSPSPSQHSSSPVKPKELQVGHWCCEVTLAQGESKRSIRSLAAGCHYPAMGGLFPIETGQVAVQLDHALVARVYKAYAALKSGDGSGHGLSKRRRGQQGIHTHPIFGYPTKADSVVLLDFRDPDFTGLIMPLRGMDKANPPDWLPVYTQQQTSKPLLAAATAWNQAQLAKYKVARKQELKAEKDALAARMKLAREQRLARFEAEQALVKQAHADQQGNEEGESLAIEVAAAVATTAAEPTCKAATLATPTIRLPARIQVPQALLGTRSGLGTGLSAGLATDPETGKTLATVSVPWREVTGMAEGIGAA